MSIFYLTFMAVLFSGLGARDQVTVASLTRRQGKRMGVLVLAGVLAMATAAFAGWAASLMIPEMQPAARVFLCALALAFAGAESLVIVPKPVKGEPTHSTGALALVLLAQQLTDAARFVIFGVAIAAHAPAYAAGGGALGGIVLLAGGWALPDVALDPRVRIARRLAGAAFLLIAGYVALRALDRI